MKYKWGKTKKVNNTTMTVEDNFAGGGYPFNIIMYNHTAGASLRGKIIFRRSDTTNIPAIESTTNVADNAYHHIVAQKSGSKLELWVDVTKEANATDTTTADTHNLSDLFFAKNSLIAGPEAPRSNLSKFTIFMPNFLKRNLSGVKAKYVKCS